MSISSSVSSPSRSSFWIAARAAISEGRDPAVPIQELQQAWVTGPIVIYIGKATVLRDRLRTYMHFGEGHPAPHWGGRYVWQLADAERLLVCWKVLTDEKQANVESQLIQQFKVRYGTRPFANLTAIDSPKALLFGHCHY